MKKITLLLTALLMTGAAFAHDGKSNCCKGKKEKECSKKEMAANKKECKEKSCCSKKSTATAKK